MTVFGADEVFVQLSEDTRSVLTMLRSESVGCNPCVADPKENANLLDMSHGRMGTLSGAARPLILWILKESSIVVAGRFHGGYARGLKPAQPFRG